MAILISDKIDFIIKRKNIDNKNNVKNEEGDIATEMEESKTNTPL